MKKLKQLTMFLMFVPQMVIASSGDQVNLKAKSQLQVNHIKLVNQNCTKKHMIDEENAIQVFGYKFNFNEKFILKFVSNDEDGTSTVGLIGSNGSLVVITTFFKTETEIDFKDLSFLKTKSSLLTSNTVTKEQKKVIDFVLYGDKQILNQGENIADLIHLENKVGSRKPSSSIYGPLNSSKKGFFRINIKPSLACDFYVTKY